MRYQDRMRLRLVLVASTFLLLGAGCFSPPPACDARTCLGCCDSNGLCSPGISTAACGSVGAQCTMCGIGQACMNGLCGVALTGGGGGSSMTGGGGGSMATGGGGGEAMTGGGGGAMATGGGGGDAMTGGGGGAAMTGGGGGAAMTGGGGGAAMTGGGGGAAMTGGGGGAMTGGGGGTNGTGLSCSSPLDLPIGPTLTGSTAMGASNFNLTMTAAGCMSTSVAPDLVYQVVVPPNTQVVVTATATTWDMSLNAVKAPTTNCGSLVGSSTQGMVCGDSSDGTSGVERVQLLNSTASPATWFIIVDGYAAGTVQKGPFEIYATVFSRPTGPSEIEPNDTRVLADATGQLLSSGAAINAELAVSEADLFRIDVANAGVLRLEVNSFDCTGFDSVQLALLDSNAAVLSTESFGSQVACRVMVAQVQPGTYYVSLARTATGAQPLGYWLTPTLLTNRSTESEPNDTTNQANLISGNDPIICGAIAATGDLTDTYIFTLSQPTSVHAEVLESSTTSTTCESGALDSRLELLSGAGLVLRTDTISGRGNCSRVESSTQLAAGTYFLRVTEQSTTRQGFPYCLSLHRY
jgi:hypothetical protein